MKKITTIFSLLLLIASTAFAQVKGNLFHSDFEEQSFASNDLDKILFSTDPKLDPLGFENAWNTFEASFQKARDKKDKWSEVQTTEKVFYTLHRKMLKWYDHYASFGDLVANGKYDCVSGTALLALALDKLQFDYTIHEFDYHTFLTVNTSEGQILLESTDPMNGVITDPKEIDRRISVYRIGGDPTSEEFNQTLVTPDQLSTHIHNEINLTQLTGLQYFNMAVKAYNEGHLEQATAQIEKAYLLYPSTRISEIRKIFSSPMLVSTR